MLTEISVREATVSSPTSANGRGGRVNRSLLGHTLRQRKIDVLSIGRKAGIHAPFGKEQKHYQKKEFQYGYIPRKDSGNHRKTQASFSDCPDDQILATGRFTSPPTPEQLKAIFPQEVPATLKLYLAGKIDQWWARQDQKGPVFLMNVTTIEEARALLDELPLGQAKLMEFEFTELSPLTPLHLLIQEA